MPQYLLDTDILSEPLKRDADPEVLASFEAHAGELVTASIVLHELQYGAARLRSTRRRQVLERYIREVVLSTLPVLPYDASAAGWHAAERARLERAGRVRPFADGQIAAIAATNGLVLVTRNTRHYSGFEGLRTESWRR
jgi:tRNA(fMet)-specific endonuclease VapC